MNHFLHVISLRLRVHIQCFRKRMGQNDDDIGDNWKIEVELYLLLNTHGLMDILF